MVTSSSSSSSNLVSDTGVSLDKRPPIICLMGPTASGKTDLAIRLREHLPVEIISVDSSQVYRGMNIGTAKPTAEELALAPHRLLDIRDPAQSYSVGEFLADARSHIDDITASGRIPLLVGGTMLYFRALLVGLAELPPANAEIRAQIESQAAEHGWPYIHGLLMAVDAVSGAKIHPNHSQRIARALEVFQITGTPLSELIARQHSGGAGRPAITGDFRVIQLALIPSDRGRLHKIIEQRFMAMLAAGFIAEVEHLFARGDLSVNLPSMRAVGYRQVWAYLAGECDYDEMIAKGIAATRQLAKRQLTWLRGWPDVFSVNTKTSEAGDANQPMLDLEVSQQILTNALNFLEKAAIYKVAAE